MTSPIEVFLTELDRRGHEPLPAAASGTIRFDARRGGRTESGLVEVDRGTVKFTQGAGQVNAWAAFLRTALHVEGDPELLIQLQRTFPGPANAPATSPPPQEHHVRRGPKVASIKRPDAAKAAA